MTFHRERCGRRMKRRKSTKNVPFNISIQNYNSTFGGWSEWGVFRFLVSPSTLNLQFPINDMFETTLHIVVIFHHIAILSLWLAQVRCKRCLGREDFLGKFTSTSHNHVCVRNYNCPRNSMAWKFSDDQLSCSLKFSYSEYEEFAKHKYICKHCCTIIEYFLKFVTSSLRREIPKQIHFNKLNIYLNLLLLAHQAPPTTFYIVISC